jgi:hypothetical protein
MLLLIIIVILLVYLLFGKQCFNIIDKFSNTNKQRKCCLIKKEYVQDDTSLYKGDFKYKYKELHNDECNFNLYEQNSSQQLFIDGENDWSNSMCNEENKQVGSCRKNNRECVDFLQKKDCDKYYMDWYGNSCQNEIPFEFKDTTPKIPYIDDINPTLIKSNKIVNDLFPKINEKTHKILTQYPTHKDK